MRARRASWLVPVLAVTFAAASVPPVAADVPTGHCKRGTKPAVIRGKHTCLKVGQRCDRRLDRRYHRYGFHCHGGRLTGRTAPPPPPPPDPPPAPPLPGRLVDVGGYRLYIECIGSGSPTVVFEGGQAGAAASNPLPGAPAVRAAVGRDTRVCVYDRAGLGASDRRPAGMVPTGERYADELHALLVNGDVPGPYVLVGPSYGGLVIAAYAMRHPAETAGLVFVDSVECPTKCTFDTPEAGEFDIGSASFGTRPVVVLKAEIGPSAGDGRDLARRSIDSILATAVGSGHAIIGERPQVVVEAIRLVVVAVRSGAPLPPCPQTPLPAAGARCETTGT